MKTVVLDGYTLNPGDLSWEGLQALGDLEVHDRTPADRILERIGDAEAVYTNKTPLTRETLESCPNLRFIGVLATGYNVVDVEAAKTLGIPIANVPTYGTNAVAQFVFALLLELAHHVGHHSDTVLKEERWTRSLDFCYWDHPLMELDGKTMGIVGLGRIGTRTARIAQAFGMQVLVYARRPDPSMESDTLRFVDLETLYGESDVISLHVPLTKETEGMVNRESISRMKTGVLLVNTSRGALVVEEDLAAALKEGKVGGAALDVVSSEPVQADNPLLQAPNILITPHIAWAPKEARQRLMDVAVDNLRAFQAGNPINIVNPQ
ncbi:D-2-hydroxyacid dehydrogenase [Anaerotalea alkaliphila]|uniref:D-2-hydroxyacid dehydrogenase n=1 Tax=Anaerotalea alkaliphila TaxID=2662126 RepID=A0A7X5HUS3_9FIRM|nr:D-2-hydroxyacid dehydrogenase [Anaerotalea alkaliphila]NDL66940.1 D-2-hydroxyacid dehydrogenase [Anaerotalea alkaliphila]